ncbi:hypothetical protein AV540_26275, partial [Brevibacillus parabrevis]|uniref:Ig-like domain-containing protein n=1 Tax=Brevibacillus parabrevis TaxID=54914 RepID=UPI0007AC04CD
MKKKTICHMAISTGFLLSAVAPLSPVTAFGMSKSAQTYASAVESHVASNEQPFAIASASAVNGRIKVTFTGKQEKKPVQGDFSLALDVNGKRQKTVKVTKFAWDEQTSTALISFSPLAFSTKEQKVDIAISYKGNESVTTSYELARRQERMESLSIEYIGADAELALGTEDDRMSLVAVARDKAGRQVNDPSVVWKSGNEKIAVVDRKGNVRAVGVGTVNITATSGKKTASLKLEVTPGDALVTNLEAANGFVSMKVHDDADNMPSADDFTLATTINKKQKNVSVSRVDWNEETQTATLVFEPIEPAKRDQEVGMAVTYKDYVVSAKPFTVARTGTKPQKVEIMHFGHDAILHTSDAEDRSLALWAVATDRSGRVVSGNDVNWQIADDSVATISENGVVTAKAAGTTEVTATIAGASATFAIEVSAGKRPQLVLGQSRVTESASNDGQIAEQLEVTLTAGTFVQDIANEDVTVAKLPAGLKAKVVRVDEQKLRISFTGKAERHTAGDSVSQLKVTVAKEKVSGASRDLTTDSFAVQFLDAVISPTTPTTPTIPFDPNSELAPNKAAGTFDKSFQLSSLGSYGPNSGLTTVNGNIGISTNAAGTITLQNLDIRGTGGSNGSLVVDAKNATVILQNVKVNGVQVQNVAVGTLDVRGAVSVIQQITITDPDGGSVKVDPNSSVQRLEIMSGSTQQPIKLQGTIAGDVVVNGNSFVQLDTGAKVGKLEVGSTVTDAKLDIRGLLGELRLGTSSLTFANQDAKELLALIEKLTTTPNIDLGSIHLGAHSLSDLKAALDKLALVKTEVEAYESLALTTAEDIQKAVQDGGQAAQAALDAAKQTLAQATTIAEWQARIDAQTAKIDAASKGQPVPNTDKTIVSVPGIAEKSYENHTPAYNFELPSWVEVTLSDGTKEELYVRWDFSAYDPDLSSKQTFTAVGTLRGSSWSAELPKGVKNAQNLKVQAKITVEGAMQVTSVASVPMKTNIENGTSFYQLGLPNEVTVTLSDNSTQNVGVTWQQGDYDPQNLEAHVVTIKGRLGDRYGLPRGIKNDQNVEAEIQISVNAAREIESITPVELTGVLSGTAKTAKALGLPETVEVVLSGGKKVAVPVQWDVAHTTYDPAKATAQTFEVEGSLVNIPDGIVPGSTLKAKAIVSTGDAVPITNVETVTVANVPGGISKTYLAAYLPKQVDVTLQDGKKAKVDVTWDVAGSTYNDSDEQEQSVVVTGTLVNFPAGVSGNNQTATANVTVQAVRYVESVDSVSIGGIANGTNATEKGFNLPARVTVNLTDNSTIQADVKWDLQSINYQKQDKNAQNVSVTGSLLNLPTGVKANQSVHVEATVHVDAEVALADSTGVVLSDVVTRQEGEATTEVLGEYFLPLSGTVTGANGQPINGPGTALLVLNMSINGTDVNTIDYLNRKLPLNMKLYVGWDTEQMLSEVASVLTAALKHHPEGKNYQVIMSSDPAGIIIKQMPGAGDEATVLMSVVENGSGSAVEGLTWGSFTTVREGHYGHKGENASFRVRVTAGAAVAGKVILHIADGQVDKKLAVAVQANDSTEQVAEKIRQAVAADFELNSIYHVAISANSLMFEAKEAGEKHLAVTVENGVAPTNPGTPTDPGTP